MATSASQNSPQSELQKAFIIMIFAFVVSFLAQEIAEFLIVLTDNWQFKSSHESWINLIPIASHMTLALLMISISWISWSKSKAAGNIQDIENIFTIKFISFILEILLVTLYYSLAKSVEVDFANYGKDKTISSYITKLSARPEILQMMLIFSMFALWDFIADVVLSPRNPPITKKLKIYQSYIPGIVVYCLISILCGLATILLYLSLPETESALVVTVADFALIVLLFLFMKAKKLEYYLCKWFPSEASRVNTNRNTPPTVSNWCVLVCFFSLFLFSILIIKLEPCIQKLLG
ncbi:TPA: hypothetical protein LUJ82_000500 [Acinetobacter baumannii]|uniref:Uncharacterized protein n=1 Tax=Acinetobacter baumannii TaxID=470 RepID=A0AA90KPD3_ACIBA|nr:MULTISPECIES: hypothetical protein [Acinetobacter calcoaceticus/baumannii complex]AYX85665.1 hypothetical protein EGX84_02625 [Acinetobacter baumannii]MBF6956708.1 hypothetical protein [Acinetobacter baumannii]MBV6769672.1 hypothetical protein [Acinetobacter baumannii]MDR9561012.1 hypothetical protein [Acinetobacter baumannii]MDR9610068.1 hypothetical protein [Acinetobacter baumannii]